MEFRKSAPADIDEMMQIVNDAKLLLKKQNTLCTVFPEVK